MYLALSSDSLKININRVEIKSSLVSGVIYRKKKEFGFHPMIYNIYGIEIKLLQGFGSRFNLGNISFDFGWKLALMNFILKKENIQLISMSVDAK